jgi:hypothetical protein
MTRPPSRSLLRALRGAAVVLASLGLSCAVARAEDEPDAGADALEKAIKEQMEKVIRLMHENEKAILEASTGSGKKPAGVDVKPPVAPEEPSMADGSPPPSGGETGEDAVPGGESTRRAIEELIRTTESAGGAIPAQIEELVKLIPLSGGGGSGGEPGDPNNMPRPEEKPGEDPTKKEQDAAKKDLKEGDQNRDKPDPESKPPEAETGDPASNGPPSWFAELPEAARRAIISGRLDDVPPKYRPLFARYRLWLAKQAARNGR